MKKHYLIRWKEIDTYGTKSTPLTITILETEDALDITIKIKKELSKLFNISIDMIKLKGIYIL